MLQLTKRTEYGLIALVHMADREGGFVSVREISEHYQVPRRLLAEVLKDLCREGLVGSARGATGGYSLSRSAESITLGEVVAALEGRPRLASCEDLAVAHDGECGLEPVCPIRSPLHRIREGIWRLMERTTLRSLARPRAGVSELALAGQHELAHFADAELARLGEPVFRDDAHSGSELVIPRKKNLLP